MPKNARIVPRNPNESFRVATPLELFFDLVYVIAISAAVNGLHHAISGGEYISGGIIFIVSFFATWWSWAYYSAYSSAFDNGDAYFKFYTVLSMLGAVFLAIGISNLFTTHSFYIGMIGFIIMRIAIILLWLRVVMHNPEFRKMGLVMVLGIASVQVYWVILNIVYPNYLYSWLLWLGLLGELLVPVFAERTQNIPWHPHHLTERYGLFAIIILGEGFVGIVNTLTPLLKNGFNPYTEVLPLGLAMSSILFSAFALYFKVPFAEILHRVKDTKRRFAVFYAYLFIYLSIALISVGLELSADAITATLSKLGSRQVHLEEGHHLISELFAASFLSAATMLYLLVLSAVQFIVASSHKISLYGLAIGISLNIISVLLVYKNQLYFQYAIWLISFSPLLNAFLYRKNKEAI